jgi:hypothetical protein
MLDRGRIRQVSPARAVMFVGIAGSRPENRSGWGKR